MSTAASTPPAPANPLEAVIARRIDFPTWLPAMLVKELRQGLRQRGFVAALVGFQIVMTLFLIFAVAGGTGSASYGTLQGAFWVMLNVQLLIITPLRALAGLQAELDARLIDLLMLTRLTAWRIVLGKWLSLVTQGILLVIAILPYGVARYFFGSVDLVAEGRIIAVILAASAVLTAGALWSSVLPKVARAGLVIVVVFLWQFIPGSFALLFASGSRSFRGGSAGAFGGPNWWVILFDFLLVLALCLVGAVRRLAPRAESQTFVTRLLPLLGFLPLAFLRGSPAQAQAMVAGVFLAFIAALEFGRPEEPMETHWTAWSRRGAWGRWVGRFVQPGWASALEWIGVVAFAGVLVACGASGFSSTTGRVVLLALFGIEALVFPVLLMTWMGRQFTHRLAGFGLVLVGASVLAAVAQLTARGGTVMNFAALIDRLVVLLPISSFWATVGAAFPPRPAVLWPQVAIAFAVLLATWLRAAPYRRQRRQFDAQPTEEPVV